MIFYTKKKNPQSIIIFPIVVSLSHDIFLSNWRQFKDHFRAFNIPLFGIMLTLFRHSYVVLITILLTGLSRAISEVGAVMIVGGNIEHYTRVMTTAIALQTRMGNLEYAMALGIVLILLTLIINSIVYLFNINLDDKFLFRVTQEVQNKSSKKVELYPYAQITRNENPDVTDFYILHEGFIGVFDEELKEEGYEDIEDRKKEYNAEEGWLGVTDKYWMTALVPEKSQPFKGEFLFKNGFKANYIQNKPVVVQPSSSKTSETKIFVAAKEVKIIDGYAESENINKFDLIIDWGWFYFFTKPLFFIMHYLFELTKNFGIAIVLVTAAVRLLFFPLSNYSFRSMAKMKILQPELLRLKELHKEDKKKLQQEMMSLYKREKVNPLSGCLPILIQIPFFFAIYKMLFISLEMRHQPFFGWIKDLSAQDPTSIFNIFGLIPWDPPSFLIIGAWPIMMGGTMYLQQKLNPTPPDPIQAKIFMFFPLFLTIILAPFPSGLVVYWTINNILTIAQQWVIMRTTTVKTK